MKIAVTPCVAFIEHFILGIKVTGSSAIALVCIIVGVGLCTVRDFSTV